MLLTKSLMNLETVVISIHFYALFNSPTVQVNYLPLSVLVTSFNKQNVKRPLEGFGVLVPSREQENGLKTLGMP